MIYSEMKELVEHLKIRSKMYVFDNTYNSLVSFLMGYQYAFLKSSGIDLSNEFQNWLRKEFETYFSVHWSSFILTELANGEEDKAKIILLNSLDDFLQSST